MNRIVIAILTWLWIGSAAHAQTAPATGVAETVTVTRGRLLVAIDADGYFEPVDSAEIRIRPESYQGELRIVTSTPAGAAVRADNVIFQLDPSDLKLQLTEAENALAASRANRAKAESDAELGEQADALAQKMAEDRLATARANLQWFDDVDGKEMLTNAELGVRRSQASVEDQTDELDQLRKMYKTEELTSATADIVVKRAVRSLELARVGLQLAQARQERVREFDHGVARQRLLFAIEQETQALAQSKASRESGAATRKTAVETARLALEKSERKLAELRRDLDAMTVRAPFDGVVYHGQLVTGAWQNAGPRQLRVGEKLTAGQVALTVVRPGQLRFVADVPEARVDWFAPGAAARVIPTSVPAPLTGKVAEVAGIGAMKDGSQFYPTKIELESLPPALRPGMRGTARIDAGAIESALLIPATAISRSRVKLHSGGETVWHDVVVGKSDGTLVQVLDGLSQGQTIAKEPK